jgi:hypothetical protein
VSGDVPATLVWISPAPPDAAENKALSSWALAHGVTLVAPRDQRPAAIAVDLGVAEPVEELLDRARDAIAARDGEGVDRATSTADAWLRAHPELPAAAWLMAEVERARATRWRRIAPEDVEAAARSWARAEALDGGRIPGIGEIAGAEHAATATVSLELPGDDDARLDGRPLPRDGAKSDEAIAARGTTRVVATRAGPHALVVTAGGAAVWAGWIEIGPRTSSVAIDAPTAVPCSTAEFARVSNASNASNASATVGASAAVDARRVTCGAWLAVSAGKEPGTIRVARCGAGRCDPSAGWPETPAWAREPPPLVTPERGATAAQHWPVWATWALAGAGVALAAGVVVVASGGLQGPPTTTQFVTGGLKSQ